MTRKHTGLLSVRAPKRLLRHLDRLASEAGERRSNIVRALLVAGAHAEDVDDRAAGRREGR